MKKKPGGQVIKLDPLCSIAGAQALWKTLNQAILSPGPVNLDAASLVKIDTAGLQLLCAFVTQARGLDQQLVWHNPSPALLDSARLLGLTRQLGLEEF